MSGAAEPIIENARRPRLSWVWLVPTAALVIALFVAWQNYSSRGPLISIEFDDASGVIVGETRLKYRDVDVGYVENVTFTDGLQKVQVHVRVDAEVAPYVDDGSRFWVVSPKISARGVSGLDTVLAGVYIAGAWDGDIGTSSRDFVGLDRAPVSQSGEGMRVVLRAKDGNQIADGTPVLHKGIEVGQLENPRLASSGGEVLVDAFIRAPHDRLITTATRFWDASGFSFSLGAGGARLDVDSLAALVGGGVSFDTLVSGGGRPEEDAIFDLFESEQEVRNSVFSQSSGVTQSFGIIFDGTVAGLSVGAPVEFRGVKVGEVSNLSAEFVGDEAEVSRVRLIVIVEIDPGALGLDPTSTYTEVGGFLAEAVEIGLRARLVTANLLTGGLKVELVELPEALPARIVESDFPYPILPSVAAEISEVSATAEGVFKRINDLPVEALMESAITLMNSVNRLANDPDLKRTPEQMVGLVEDARKIVSTEEMASIPDDVARFLSSLNRAAADVEKLAAELASDQVAMDLVEAISNANRAAKDVASAADGLPAIAKQLEGLAAKADELPIDDLVASTSRLVGTVDAFVSSDAVEKLPPALNEALEEIRVLTATINQGDLIGTANTALTSAKDAADQIASASKNLPALVARLNSAAAAAQATLSDYSSDSRISQSALAAIKEVERAAEAVTSLARTIERRPNALITGR